MRGIGGYFELEPSHCSPALHVDCPLVLKSARACLAVLADRERPGRVWAPHYICEVALDPIRDRGIDIRRYRIDAELEVADVPAPLGDDERLLYVNYFGLKSAYAATLAREHRHRLWLDNVQAFFDVGGSPDASRFNSARKFFGVADGAFLSLADGVDGPTTEELELPANVEYVTEHLTARLAGDIDRGRRWFAENERLAGRGTMSISDMSRAQLDRIDYVRAARTRRHNYRWLHERLSFTNRLAPSILELHDGTVPFCYPYLPTEPMSHATLWDEGIYAPRLWPDSGPADGWEAELVQNLLPLPVDQRYGVGDMDRIVNVLLRTETAR